MDVAKLVFSPKRIVKKRFPSTSTLIVYALHNIYKPFEWQVASPFPDAVTIIGIKKIQF